MKILKNYDNVNEYLDIDSKNIYCFEGLQANVGVYKIADSVVSGIFVEKGNMYFFVDSIKYKINDECKVIIDNTQNKTDKILNLYEKDNLIFSLSYQVEEDISQISPFEYLDKEDIDWGLFLSKIINNEKRKENFITIKMRNY